MLEIIKCCIRRGEWVGCNIFSGFYDPDSKSQNSNNFKDKFNKDSEKMVLVKQNV